MDELKTATRFVGDGGNRKELDFYPTPAYATEMLLKKEAFNGNIWECACGDGAISKVLITSGFDVISTDIADRGFGTPDVDFLWPANRKSVSNIITNPPFNLALEFINESKQCAQEKIAMFLKTTFLEGVKRYSMFTDEEFPLKCMYQFSKRVSFGKAEGTHKNGGMMAFAWFVWDRNYNGKPYIDWIR
jgi:hypothetical protein